MGGEQVAVDRIVAIGEEGARAGVAALGDLMPLAGNGDAGEAGHAARRRGRRRH